MVCNCMLVYVWAMVMISVSPLLVNAHICSDDFLIKAESLNIITNCNLLSLGAEFAWKFDNTSRQLDVAVGARLESPTAWLAWGLNPDGPHMAGTRTLMGVKHQTGLAPRKFNITDATKRHCMLRPSDNIGLNITNFTFSYLHDIMYYMIRATIILPDSYNASRANIVWQIGEAAVSADKPRMHSTSLDYLDASRTINLITGERLSLDPNQRTRMRTAHGVLNMVGWGIFLPTGAIVARYLRCHPKKVTWWGAFHVGCQSMGYLVGSIGWGIGLWLGQASKCYTFTTHRILAIMLFTFTTIQMTALRLKPKRADEYRTYWNMYHHFLGYSLIVVAAVNIFQGISIIESGAHHHWRWSYVGALGLMGAVATSLELYSWLKFRKATKNRESLKITQSSATAPEPHS
ncbi:cytochrome b561 and DOMON domain-containing protein At5g47530-like isoform X1 [Salvia splendens]|uniref:cytochrome b561 and DOMON domain-containing protein At5g47530-like isoform X1 n=1 Tax=Salvia splendens TaxID=180675 RepID=UPI001100AA87|nr:cytochrome b561 and DOMON domain-containing protein At5g47530-like isoform X1 [Salvia splendens]